MHSNKIRLTKAFRENPNEWEKKVGRHEVSSRLIWASLNLTALDQPKKKGKREMMALQITFRKKNNEKLYDLDIWNMSDFSFELKA